MATTFETPGAGTNLGGAMMCPPALHVDIRGDGGTIVLALHGEADLATAPQLTAALAGVSERGTAHVVLDAARLEFIDAHCLGVIADARALLRAQDRDLLVRSPAPRFHRVLTIFEMEALIEHTGDSATDLPSGLT